MGTELWLLTEEGIRRWDGELLQGTPFPDRSVTAGLVAEDTVAIIVDEQEVWVRMRGAWAREATSKVALYSLAQSRDGRLLVGMADAQLAWLEDRALHPVKSFQSVPERRLWDTPYGAPPELRSLAVGVDGTIYANVHVGWIVRSLDNGTTWRSLRNGLDRDVHQVATHPTDPKTVFAATAEGFHISHDRGDTFLRRPEGMPYLYQRSTACFPDRDVYLTSTAKHNGGAGARLYRSEDEGIRWERVRGLPETLNRNINTHQVLVSPAGHSALVASDTDLYATDDYGKTWHLVRKDLPTVNAILAI